MIDLIPVPSKESPILASWGASVANGLNSLASMSSPGMLAREGVTGTGGEPCPKNLRERGKKTFLHPFEVRWDGSLNDGEGSWIIFLPGDEIVTADGQTIDPSEELDPTNADNPNGWYVLDNEMLDQSSGGTLYLNVEKESEDDSDADSDEESLKASFSSEASEEDEAYVAAICEASVDADTGARYVQNFVTSALFLGAKGVKSITGETASSEKIKGDIEISGKLDPDDETTSCGIEFTTVSAREADGDDPARPPRIIAKVKGQDLTDPNEDNWGAHEIKFTDTSGNRVTAHVFSCADIEIQSGVDEEDAQSYDNANVIGSDYIDVDDEEEDDGDGNAVAVRQVKAKILTGVTQSETADDHALLTHDTEQKVLAKKTFQNAAGTNLVEVDGPNGNITLSIPGASKSITLDPSSIPAECTGGAIGVHELKFKDKDNVTHKYHGLFCGDIDLTRTGKLIDHVTLDPSSASGGFNTIVFYYTDGTTTTVTIQNGIDGSNGDKGDDGDSPEIEVEKNGTHTYIYVDGDLKATIEDGVSPQITMGTRPGNPMEHPVFSNGVEIGYVTDGAGAGSATEIEFITDIAFSMSGNNVVATLTRKKGKVIDMQSLSDVTKTVVTGTTQTVVESESYSTSTREFTNTRKSVIVIGSSNVSGQTVFTATPHNTGS